MIETYLFFVKFNAKVNVGSGFNKIQVFDICQTIAILVLMVTEKYITTRELLRGFKKYKEMLLSGKVMHLVISIENGQELEVTKRQKGLSGKELARRIRALKKPIHIERPVGLFDEILERAEQSRDGK